jgi:PAS domain S-box-containing protein
MTLAFIKTYSDKNSAFKNFAVFSVCLFLLIMFVSAFFVVPKFNSLLDNQHEQDIQNELALEAALFSRFVVSQQSIVQDLAAYPMLAGAVMLGDINDISITELFENSVIGGEQSRLVLQDIAGSIVIKTDNKLYGNYSFDQQWIEQILQGVIPSHFQLLRQNNTALTFKVSVPVLYNGYIEGILSSEITIPLEDIFVTQKYKEKVAFRLTQGTVKVSTSTEHIEISRENTLTLPDTDIVFTYISDDSLIYDGKRELQNTILLILLISFTFSFLLFSGLNYKGLSGSEGSAKVKLATWRVYSIPIIVGVIGVAASISAFMIESNIKISAVEKELIYESKEKVKVISKNIDLNLQILDAVKALYNASNYVSRQEFNAFVTPLLSNYKNLKAIEWVPYITHEQRPAYEQRARTDGLIDFTLTEIDATGNMVLANERDSYLPVYYIEPLEGNEKAMGLDNAANKERLNTINQAISSGDKIATGKINLVQAVGDSADVLVFNAVYDQSLVDGKFNSTSNFIGLAVLVLNIGDIVADTAIEGESNLSLYLEDITEIDNIERLYGTLAGNSWFSHSEIIKVAGRSWHIETHTNTAKTPLMFSAWLILITSLAVTALITFSITHLIRRREVVEQLVVSRTVSLIESEEQHRAVVENAVDGLLTIDEFGIIEKYNPAAEHIFGYTADEIIGENLKILLPAKAHKDQDAYLEDYRNTGIKKNMGIERKLSGRRKDGTIFPVELSISDMVIGKARKLSGIVRDVTERVMLEQEREKFIDKLTDSNEELARFAYVCSHDLQEPLRMVCSFSELLQDHLADDLKDDAKGQKYFNFVIDGAARAQLLITDILSYSSINSDTKMNEYVNLAEVLTVITSDLLDSSTGNKGEITSDTLPTLQGNRTQLFQLFQNLLSNGLKYQKTDGIPHVHIGVENNEKYWLFSFKDNGIGMQKKNLNRIFEVFKRLHGKKQYAGTGVGLAICKKVVERHGGAIWVESEVNVGSTFFVKLLKATDVEET